MTETIEPPEHEEDEQTETEVQVADEEKLRGIQQNWNTDADWDGTDYRMVGTPDPRVRPYEEWDVAERRAWLFEELKECGTWSNSELSQSEVGEMFGVTQQTISKDLDELRRYIRFHAGDKAISMSEMVARKAVTDLLDSEPYKAWSVQREFNEFLFELGRLDRAPDKKQVHNINQQVSDDSLSDEEAEQIQSLADQLEDANEQRQTQSGDEDVIDVDYEEASEDDE